jgi:3-hydroxyisobutyrate dehydrogenase
MAKNLRQKIPKADTLYVQDVNVAATKRFVDELAGHSVVIAGSAREVAENAVSLPSLHNPTI